jgi:hypothetical protein
MTTVDFNSEQFMQLLTDALRAGPGTPAWRDAVARLRQGAGNGSAQGVSEYELLLAAREHLESGKAYREIRPGPLFTRKVMEAVEGEQQHSRRAAGLPTPAIIAIVAGLVGLCVIALVTYLLMTGGRPQTQSIAELASQAFGHDVLSAPFGTDIPSGWKAIGSLQGTFEHEFRAPVEGPNGKFGGSGIVTMLPLPPDEPAQIEVTFRLPLASQTAIPQVFVTDQADFNPERGTSSHELLLDIQPILVGKRPDDPGHYNYRPQVVLPDGSFGKIGDDVRQSRDTFSVRIPFNGDLAIVEVDGKRLYAGPNQLSPTKPRYVGVRFLRRGELESKYLPAVVSIRVSKG